MENLGDFSIPGEPLPIRSRLKRREVIQSAKERTRLSFHADTIS